MNCNFTFYLFVSSSLLYSEVVVNFFDYFWKPKTLFSNFVITVFWCTLSYTVLIVLWKLLLEPVNAHARWWPCACLKCGSGLRRLEKTLDFLRSIHVIDLVLKYGSDINEGNWLQLLLYFTALIGIVASNFWMIFFSAVFQVLHWKFLVLQIDGNDCNWITKVIWPWTEWFWGLLFGNGFFRWLYISMD